MFDEMSRRYSSTCVNPFVCLLKGLHVLVWKSHGSGSFEGLMCQVNVRLFFVEKCETSSRQKLCLANTKSSKHNPFTPDYVQSN